MSTWSVSEVTLEGRYISNRPNDILTLPCRFVSETPGRYVDQIGADDTVMQSELEPRCLLLNGIDLKTLNGVRWPITDVSFKDTRTGESHEFHAQRYGGANIAKFALGH